MYRCLAWDERVSRMRQADIVDIDPDEGMVYFRRKDVTTDFCYIEKPGKHVVMALMNDGKDVYLLMTRDDYDAFLKEKEDAGTTTD